MEAGSLRSKKVLCRCGDAVGVVQNVLFECDARSPGSFLLVFPEEKNWLRTYFVENWGRIGIEMVKSVIPEEASAIMKDVQEKGEAEALKIWGKYVEDNAEKLEQMLQKCYLFPCSQIDEARTGNDVWLVTGKKDVEEYGGIGIPELVTDGKDMVAFFKNSNQPSRNHKSLLPVSLNLSTLHFKSVSDVDRQRGSISDLQIDVKSGLIANFVIDVMGKDSGKRLVPFGEVNFDSMCLKKKRSFGFYPVL